MAATAGSEQGSGALELLASHTCHGGLVRFYRHASRATQCAMRFGIFVPDGANAATPRPVLYYLAGLTCTEETFLIKAGALRRAAELGLVLVAPDTSPRDVPLPGDRDHWDFGVAAGFYLDATQSPWSAHYRMETYVSAELPALVAAHFPVDPARTGLFGHSMGGHGALTLALKHPTLYRSVSAFAPISAASQCPWGEKALGHYLGADRAAWLDCDAASLITRHGGARWPRPVLVDQGLADPFLERELKPALLADACRAAGVDLVQRLHEGYDHGYYFIQSFIDDHLAHHARELGA